MKHFIKVILLVVILLVGNSFTFKRMNYEDARVKNVCKTLSGNVLAYFVFVDTKSTYPWTQFDIQSTLDSMEVAIRWIEKQAADNGISLNIILDYYIGDEFTTVKKNLAMNTVRESVYEPNFKKGLAELNDWADGIAKRVGTSFNITDKDGIPEIKNPRDKERLISFLRDENKVESVALIYMVNNYFKDDISIPVNIYGTNDVEFGVVSYKYPSVIAHNILHLFGAADLYETPYRRNAQKLKTIESLFHNEIMQDAYGKDIQHMQVSGYTKYLIGWKDDLNEKYTDLLTDNFINF